MRVIHINRMSDSAVPDTMPVVKTTEYPWTDGSYRPLMYARCAYSDRRGMFVDLMCFQRDPELADELLDSSCGAVSLYSRGDVVSVVSDCVGRCVVYRNGKPERDIAGECEFYSGDDEQGWYHGVRFYLEPSLVTGGGLEMNFFKFQRVGELAHMGAAAEMKEPFIFSRENLCPAVIEDY